MTDHPASNPNQPDALVEAGAQALLESRPMPDNEDAAFETALREARTVLAAVLSEVERHAKADALREAAVEIPGSDTNERIDPYDRAAEWLIDRADQIEKKGDDR